MLWAQTDASIVWQMQDTPSYVGGFSLPLLQRRRPDIAALLDEWLLSLPRYLWELGSNDIATSQVSSLFLSSPAEHGR